MKNIICVLVAGLFGMSIAMADSSFGLTVYPNCVLVEHGSNDADSFMVDTGTEQLHLRLYFVDSPEKNVYAPHDARRVQEQARYFGIENPQSIVYLGEQASAFTRELLARPFTVYTAHSRALGGAGSKRIYGFVVTADGRDLGELLIEQGFARNFGVSRQNYAGVAHTDVEVYLRDLESVAMLKRRGAWEISNPELLVQFRAQQRQEKQSMQTLMSSATRLLESPVNINNAGQKDLERIPGIGPVTAGRIIQARPFNSLEDLMKVQGVGKKLYERILPYVSIDENPTSLNG